MGWIADPQLLPQMASGAVMVWATYNKHRRISCSTSKGRLYFSCSMVQQVHMFTWYRYWG